MLPSRIPGAGQETSKKPSGKAVSLVNFVVRLIPTVASILVNSESTIIWFYVDQCCETSSRLSCEIDRMCSL